MFLRNITPLFKVSGQRFENCNNSFQKEKSNVQVTSISSSNKLSGFRDLHSEERCHRAVLRMGEGGLPSHFGCPDPRERGLPEFSYDCAAGAGQKCAEARMAPFLQGRANASHWPGQLGTRMWLLDREAVLFPRLRHASCSLWQVHVLCPFQIKNKGL